MSNRSVTALDQKLGWRILHKGSKTYLDGLPRAELDKDEPKVLTHLLLGISGIKKDFSHETRYSLRRSENFIVQTNTLFDRLGPQIWSDEGTELPFFVEPTLQLKFSSTDNRK